MVMLRELRPDVVLTQVQDCEGAISRLEMEADLAECLGNKNLKVVHSDPQTLQEVWKDMQVREHILTCIYIMVIRGTYLIYIIYSYIPYIA
jgi:hypothetical protein